MKRFSYCSFLWLVACGLWFASCAAHGDGGHDHDGDMHDDGEGAAVEHHHSDDETELSIAQQERMGVAVTTVRPQPFSGVIKVGGTIVSAPADATTIMAPASGQIALAQDIVDGTQVGASSTLFVIDSEALASTGSITQARLKLEAAEKVYSRACRLFEIAMITQGEMDEAQAQYNLAKAEYQAATKGGAAATAVKAPFTGYITGCMVRTGDYVEAGQPLTSITRGANMMLQAELPERHFARLDDIVSARFKPSYSTQVLDIDSLGGHLVAREAVVRGGGFLRVTFSLLHPVQQASDNPHAAHAKIVPGCYADVWLVTRSCHEALCLPLNALVREGELYFVFVREDETCFVKREVRLADNDGTQVEIVEGIAAGDQVVTQGVAQLAIAASAKVIPAHTHNH